MFKLVLATLIASILLSGSIAKSSTTLAETCASNCGRRPIQFTPGQIIRLEVINTTTSLVKLEKLQGNQPILLQPGQKFRLEQGDGTQPNISLVFWDDRGLPLQAIVSQPNSATLRLEIRRGNRNPGDRSLYILNDGRVNVF